MRSMDRDDAELLEKLAVMKRGYALKLRVRLEGLRESIARARAGEPSGLEDAVREAHQLHGTAGSYGFLEISELTGEVERMLEQLSAERAQPLGPSMAADWDAVLQRVEHALAMAVSGSA